MTKRGLARSVCRMSGLLLLVFAGWACDSDSGGNAGTPVLDTREVRLTSDYDGRLMIGKGPGASSEFPFDARGPGSLGTMSPNCEGLALDSEQSADCESLQAALDPGEVLLFFDSDDIMLKHLYPFGETIPVYIEILPEDMLGTIDFCTGEVSLKYLGLYTPVVFDQRLATLIVDSTMTTGTSSGDYWEVTGEKMDEAGNHRLVSVAVVPPTGDPAVDGSLDLPTDAVSDIPSHLDFPDGRFPCPGGPPPGPPTDLGMKALKDGVLSMEFLGTYTRFPYDGKGSGGTASILDIGDGVVQVEFTDYQPPDLQFIPGVDAMGVRIEPNRMAGEIDLCTGRVDLEFDANFTPFMGNLEMFPMHVVTTMTTGQAEFIHHTDFEPLTGKPLDKWGDAMLVGIADVPPIPPEEPGAAWINFLLSLPNDAVEELPVHLDFIGGEPPGCH